MYLPITGKALPPAKGAQRHHMDLPFTEKALPPASGAARLTSCSPITEKALRPAVEVERLTVRSPIMGKRCRRRRGPHGSMRASPSRGRRCRRRQGPRSSTHAPPMGNAMPPEAVTARRDSRAAHRARSHVKKVALLTWAVLEVARWALHPFLLLPELSRWRARHSTSSRLPSGVGVVRRDGRTVHRSCSPPFKL